MANIKDFKCVLLPVGLLFGLLIVLTSCTNDTVSINTVKDIRSEEISNNTIETSDETPALRGNTTVQHEDVHVGDSNHYGFLQDISNPYKEYINSLKYLDELEAKIPMANTTFDMVTASESAFNAWDKELNKIYRLLIEKLSTEDIQKLKTEERLWIKEKEEKANSLKSSGGSLAMVDTNNFLLTETKRRTLELIHRYYIHNYDINQAVEAYRAVLQNEAKFFSINNKINDDKDTYLDDSFFSVVDANHAKLYFTVIDMDGDGILEIVVQGVYESGNVAMSRILHYEDGTVYGYFFGARELDNLKKDGTFSWSGGGSYSGCSNVQFFGVYAKETFLAEYYVEDGSTLEKYFINNMSVPEEEFDTYCNNQNQKKDVVWYELNKDNINSQVVATASQTESTAHKPTEVSDLTFADLVDMVFYFSSGVGAWQTEVKISADGTFNGYHSDADMGDTGSDYPNGTQYFCSFSGKFSSLTKTGDYQYSMKCDFITQEGTAGEVEIGEDGVRYITSSPYGFDNADEFILYLPGKRIDELPEEFKDWVGSPRATNFVGVDTLPFYGLYNVSGKQGFSN